MNVGRIGSHLLDRDASSEDVYPLIPGDKWVTERSLDASGF